MSFRRAGFTLFEVVIGLVLMGSLVASALVALSSQQQAVQLAKQKQQANQIAESLLSKWYDLYGNVPPRGQGIVDSSGTWYWRTQVINARVVCGLPVNIIRFEVLALVGSNREPTTLLTIELLQSQNVSFVP